MGKVKLYFNVGDYFGKSLSIDLPLTYRFVYICVSEKFAYSEVVSSLGESTTKSERVILIR